MDGSGLAWVFAALCVAMAASRAAAQMAMIRLGQGAVAELGVYLVRRTLMMPLRAFERIDSSAILAAMTEDTAILANALVGVPHLCINIPIVIACLAYIGWLSPTIFAAGVVFAALAIAAYLEALDKGVERGAAPRDRQDAPVGHFRTAIEGFRELKLHQAAAARPSSISRWRSTSPRPEVTWSAG